MRYVRVQRTNEHQSTITRHTAFWGTAFFGAFSNTPAWVTNGSKIVSVVRPNNGNPGTILLLTCYHFKKPQICMVLE